MQYDPCVTEPPEVLRLLSDPLRWQLMRALAAGDHRVGELVDVVGKPQNLVSYHLADLRRAGLVSARRSSADGRDVYYRAELNRCGELIADAGRSLHPGLEASSPRHALPSRPALAATHARLGGGRRHRPRVLFLCTGNSARSQIAEALLDRRAEGGVEARSAGSHPKPLHPNAARVMAERGVDISTHASKPLTRFVKSRFDRVITLCDKVREICPEFPGAPLRAHWSIPDPSGAGTTDRSTYPMFVAIADDIDDRVELLLAELFQ